MGYRARAYRQALPDVSAFRRATFRMAPTGCGVTVGRVAFAKARVRQRSRFAVY